jgi:hypothetical protein
MNIEPNQIWQNEVTKTRIKITRVETDYLGDFDVRAVALSGARGNRHLKMSNLRKKYTYVGEYDKPT